MKAIALIDGEHVPAIVSDALAELPYDWVGAILVGGSEKLRGEPAYGVPLLTDFADAELVVDLSDEPVLGPGERFRWRPARSRPDCRTSGRTSASTRLGSRTWVRRRSA